MSDVDRLVRYFEEAEQLSMSARAESEQARDYYDSKQITAEQRKQLNKRKQPIVWENLISAKIDYLRGLERQSRTTPKGLPRTAMHHEDAFAVTDALRYVATDQFFDIKRSIVFENMMIEGYGGVEVGAARVRNGIDPTIEAIEWDRLFFDPHSRRHDFSDARYKGFITWLDTDEAKAYCEEGGKWAGKLDVIEQTEARGVSSLDDTYSDKPRNSVWSDRSRGRIRVVTIYYLKGNVWHRAVFTLAGELEPSAPSPFLDEDGRPECALILESAKVDRDNDRYGIVRDMIPLQDEVNKRRGKLLHNVSTRGVRVSADRAQDAETLRREASRPDPVFIAGEAEIISGADLASGQMQMLLDTRASLKGAGPNAHLQGKAGEGQSGRAILALQQGGMTEMAPLLDNLRHFNRRVYRAIWNRIRQFWTAERWVRVTDDDENIRFVGFNVTKGHLAQQKIIEALNAGQIDQATAQAYAQQIQFDPAMREPANVVAEMDVDIEIDEVMDSPMLQIEQFEELVKLAAMAPDKVPFKMLIEASSLRDKPKLLKILEDAEAAQKQPNPAQELAMREAAAKVVKLEAEGRFTEARAEHEAAKPALEGMRLGFAA